MYCLRVGVGTESPVDIGTLARERIHWDGLVHMAQAHGVIPLLYWSLHDTCRESVPKLPYAELQRRFQMNRARNIFMTSELIRIIDLFESNDIPAFSFKGPLLAAYLYGDPTGRQHGDLDVMVKKQDVFRAGELLASQGYRLQDLIDPSQKTRFLDYENELPYVHAKFGNVIDLQWKIAPEYFCFPLSPEHIWKRLETVSIDGRRLLSICPEDLILILSMHGTKHSWDRLSLVCDLARLVLVKNEIDWTNVIDRARALDGERMLALSLHLVLDILGGNLPESVRQWMTRDRKADRLAAERFHRLFVDKGALTGYRELYCFHLRVRENLKGRTQYLLRRMVYPAKGDWTTRRQPDFLFHIHRLLRPFRLTVKYGMKYAKRICSVDFLVNKRRIHNKSL